MILFYERGNYVYNGKYYLLPVYLMHFVLPAFPCCLYSMISKKKERKEEEEKKTHTEGYLINYSHIC